MASRTIVVLQGDQTGEELLVEALRVLSPNVIRYQLEFAYFDLSLAKRRDTKNKIVYEAAAALNQHGLGIKAATITPEEKGDVGSPNAILRDEIKGEVILRTGRRIPGCGPSAESTRRSRWCAWRLTMPTTRRNGARAKD